MDFALRDDAPHNARHGVTFAFGRYREPVHQPDTGVGVSRLRLKEWCYQSVATPEVWLAFAIAQLGYVAQAFVYVIDRRTGQRFSAEFLSPLGYALQIAPSSVGGTSRYRARGVSIETGFEAGIRTRIATTLSTQPLSASFCIVPDDALSLIYPFAPDRAAYTHKAAGMRVVGTMKLGARSFDLRDGLATLDWTRSHALRHTRWNWASFVGHTDSGKRFGLNLSAHVYDDAQGNSLENAVWLEGRVQTLSGVRFEVPARTTDAWRMVSRDGRGEVDLELVPSDERRSTLDLRVLRSVFVQPYGEASGTVLGERVSGVAGVVEDHDALW